MDTNSIKEKAKDWSIKGISAVCGVGHFVGRLTADAFKELEAQSIYAVDKGVNKRMIRIRRDYSYAQRMRDLSERINETKKVINDTYHEIADNPVTEETLSFNDIIPPTAAAE